MPVSIDIQPYSSSLDMLGEPDSSSSFSLSGHISISLTSSLSIFQRRRAATRLLLQSLTVTFEGQSEVITSDIGYTPLRLCSITRELVNGEPVDLSNEGHEESDKPCSWNVVFDIQVPGWLPETAVYGDSGSEEAGTRYALYATATFLNIDDASSRSFSFSTLCSPFRVRTRIVDAPRCPITINRFTEAPADISSSTSLFPMSTFSIDTQPEYTAARPSRSMPVEILDKLEVLASVPSSVSVEESSVPFTLRLRAKDLDDSHRERLRMTEFVVNIEQVESYRSTLKRDHIQRYHLPPLSEQPPNLPLRHQHTIHTLYDVGLLTSAKRVKTSNRAFSLMGLEESGRYQVYGDGRIFLQGENAEENATEDSWFLLETNVPIAPPAAEHDVESGHYHIQHASTSSPLFTVKHQMHVALRCTYDMPDGQGPVSERLQFTLPMSFVRVAPSPRPAIPEVEEEPGLRESTTLKRSAPYACTLPAYSQLFDANGDRKIDYSVPLPLYEPPTNPSSSYNLGIEDTSKHYSNVDVGTAY
ncbi:hypothetical protein SERLA73DRAFT_154934 [Serpula lacrymans var. lacrymans S7.3]|uniref:Arrestin-like N-terminal domain-containing protein n=2 Tax=Serpula lacrymans var. lacrymans TaxID=341189 RepID=F8Q7M1_SERL3|nr:uncharacterized protein SERLADRAFT_372896 [Serpula lacrymans var. lacrymans S7.9]EGN95559.1 hypothetical protein SERLA73DRAFT_154934 [Serpula lacrymans var. lacrymans S7.3]EGO21087.1 hypothetical protein SERLADRAFT_372896 [Serpula lacrymans var. lacrymans S7.9]